MGFTVQEYLDLVRLLGEHPEWRSELRKLLLSDELLRLPELVQELIKVQRRTEEQLGAAQHQTEERLERLEATVEKLAEAQRQTEVTLRNLIVTVGDLKGRSLEMAYRDEAVAYFGSMLRRTRVVAFPTLEEELESLLSDDEGREVLLLDLVVRGKPRQRPDILEVWLAVEISAVVDQEDLKRAQRRATLLNQAGYQAIPVVAGEQIIPEVEEAARIHKVVVLRGGKVSFWEEAPQAWITT